MGGKIKEKGKKQKEKVLETSGNLEMKNITKNGFPFNFIADV